MLLKLVHTELKYVARLHNKRRNGHFANSINCKIIVELEALRVQSCPKMGQNWTWKIHFILYFCHLSWSSEQFHACIDDSDCAQLSLGHEFACFVYMCYPWKNPTPSHPNCFQDKDCFGGQGKCVKHPE